MFENHGKEPNRTMISARRLFACLSDELRLAALLLLHAHGELCVCELVTALDQSQPKVSRHLAQLRNCGIVQDRRQGQWVYYRLNPGLPSWTTGILDQASQAESSTLKAVNQRLKHMTDRPERAQSAA